MDIFASTLNQTLFLFSFIAIGFVLGKKHIIPDNSATVLSKLENVLFIPALVMGTFIRNFTPQRIHDAWQLLLISFGICFAAILCAIVVSKLVTKDRYIQKIYTYGLAFSNFGFMGNAVVSAMFPDIFFEYLIFTLPLWIMIYLWGVPSLLIAESDEKQSLNSRLRSFVNPMFVGMLIGMTIGLTGIKIPQWLQSAITVSGDCMSPVAMLLTGITVSAIDMRKCFTDISIYIVSAVRLVAIPLAFVAIAQIIPMDSAVYTCALCSLAMPLGLNTIVIPAAYGKDTSTAAGMAVVSHLLSCITIPLIFTLL